jgi:hypothetical protein
VPTEPENDSGGTSDSRGAKLRILLIAAIAYGILTIMCIIAGILIAMRLS